MIKNLTHKQFFYVYLAGFILVLLVVYGIALKPTFELKKTCKEKEAILASVSLAPQQIKLISEKLGQIESRFSSLSMEENRSRDRILEEIGDYCNTNRIVVYNYPELHLFNNKSFTVESNRIVVKGDFKKLIKLINYLETKADFGRIVSLKYKSELNRKSKRKELFLELIFQNIRSNE